MLKIIQGTKKDKPELDKTAMHSRIIDRCLEKEPNKENHGAFIYNYVRYANTYCAKRHENKDLSLLYKCFDLLKHVKSTLSLFTPNELINIFPITKEYDGEKWGTKDYFYTMNVLKKHGLNKQIGEEISNILWDYMNPTLMIFNVNLLAVMSDIRRAEDGKGLMEEFCEDMGIPTYTMTTDASGKQYMTNNDTGEIARVRKPLPRHLRSVE